MHVEMMLVCKIIQNGKLPKAIEFGITPDDFTTSEAQAIYRRLMTVYQHAESSGTVLGPTMAAKEFPNLPWAQVDEHVTLEYLFHEVRRGRLLAFMSSSIVTAAKLLEQRDLHAAIAQIQMCLDTVRRVETTRNHDTDGIKGLAEAEATYDKRKSGEDNGVMAWPWYELTKQAGPLRSDDYIIYYGRPKTMKSWLLLYQAADAVLFQDIPIVIYTKEMTVQNVYMRLASIISMVPYGSLRLGQLTPYYEKQFREGMEHIRGILQQHKDRLWVLSGKDMGGKDTISWFRSKVERYKPKAAFIDGMYLMSPENTKLVKTNERLENVSRAARQMVLELNVPLICTLQANRQAAKHDKGEMDEIAMSDAFSQDCTAAIRTIRDKAKQPDGRGTVSLVVAGSREWDLEGLRVYAEPATDFSFCQYLSDKEVAKAKSQDDEDGDKKKAAAGASAKATSRREEAEAAAAAIVKRQ